MPHIGCGADVLRWRREKAQEVRRLQILGLLPKPEDFKPAKNCQYPHQTPARDPQIFNSRRCSWVRIAELQAERERGSSVSSAPAMGDREGRMERNKAGHRRVLSATNSVEGCNLSRAESSITFRALRGSGSTRDISNCTEAVDVRATTIVTKRGFFRRKSKSIQGADAFNQGSQEVRNMLERSQSLDSPTKRSKNIENQNIKKYFSQVKGRRSEPRERSAKHLESSDHYLVSAEVHHPDIIQPPPNSIEDADPYKADAKLASLASIDEILEFEQEMEQLEKRMLKLNTAETVV